MGTKRKAKPRLLTYKAVLDPCTGEQPHLLFGKGFRRACR